VRDHVERVTDDVERIADIELVTSELVTNAVEHGEDHQVTVAVRTAIDAIVVSVTSSGSTRSLGEPASWAEPLPVDRSGRGLAFVRAVSDRVTVDIGEDTLTVNCEFRLAN
jgi:anti-sigma regulatory factor (Ser/Thr protein kinase)